MKQIACPPLTCRKAALLQEPGWVIGSVLGGCRERTGGERRAGYGKAALHSLTQSKYVSKGTVTAKLCARLSVETESQSQTSSYFLSQCLSQRPPATALPSLSDSRRSSKWFPYNRSEINSRQCLVASRDVGSGPQGGKKKIENYEMGIKVRDDAVIKTQKTQEFSP